MKFLYYTILILLLGGCEKNKIIYKHDPKWDIATYVYNNEIGKKVFVQLKKEKNLSVCESGFALLGTKEIQCMHCGFNYFNEITLDEARGILVEAISLYLDAINKNERIRPFLNHHPFTPENVEIRIFLFTRERAIPAPEKLQFISFTEGKLKYSIGVLDSRRYPIVVCEETYEEAMEKLRKPIEDNTQIIKTSCI
jgi:predicted RNase H-like HicB family nuclease